MHKCKGTRKHLNVRQRIYIEVAIKRGDTASQIANYLGFSRQAIYRELKSNARVKSRRGIRLSSARIICPKLFKYPFVCNNCLIKQTCTQIKRYYNGTEAHEIAKSRLSGSRSFPRLNQGALLELSNIVEDGLDKGQSLHHICRVNKDKITVSERTIRNYIAKRHIASMNIDLPLQTRFKKPLKRYARASIRDAETLLGRSYFDFKSIVHASSHYAQMDTVIGKFKEKPCLLTIFLPKYSFLLARLLNACSSVEVNKALLKLRDDIGHDTWLRVFPFILTDRGFEFTNLHELEKETASRKAKQHIKVFFTDPYRSNQKAEIESAHRFIRRIIPKSTSFTNFTQDDIDLMCSHINAVIRRKQNNKTGYELVLKAFGKKFLDDVNITYINPKDVTIKPYLLHKKKKKNG
ncbi:MAG: IS30 family transposase [Bacilli bacterium]|jgi:IS30 family transposase|nr:MAG: IS30 family transposase [Fermentimonas caenicola]